MTAISEQTASNQESTRWKTAIINATRNTLADRWHKTTEQWLAARAQYRTLFDAEATDICALRKAAKRLHDLEQQRFVLSQELNEMAAQAAAGG